jgi:hypothetical protein
MNCILLGFSSISTPLFINFILFISTVRVSAGAGNVSLYHYVQNGSGAHPTSYPMGTGNKAAVE